MYGIWTILPPIFVITFALTTKNVILSLALGVGFASIIMNGANFLVPMSDYVLEGVNSNCMILFLIVVIGIMLYFMREGGGFKAVSQWARRKVADDRQVGLLTLGISAILSVNDLLANLTLGYLVSPLASQHKVARAKIGFINCSTAPNVASYLPFVSYFLFCSGMISSTLGVDGTTFFYKGIWFSFYTILSIIMAFMMAMKWLPDIGPMKRLQFEATSLGQTLEENNEDDPALGGKDVKPDMLAFVLPIAGLIIGMIVFSITTGEMQMVPGMLIGMIVAIVYPLCRHTIHFSDLTKGFINGFTDQAVIFLVLVLSFTFGAELNMLGFSDYVISLFSANMFGRFVPVAIFLIATLIGYSTGSLGSALVIVMPLALPLAQATGASLLLTFGATYSGAQWGDQSSPISDVIIENSGANGMNPGDFAKAILPYRLIELGICFVLYTVLGFVMH